MTTTTTSQSLDIAAPSFQRRQRQRRDWSHGSILLIGFILVSGCSHIFVLGMMSVGNKPVSRSCCSLADQNKRRRINDSKVNNQQYCSYSTFSFALASSRRSRSVSFPSSSTTKNSADWNVAHVPLILVPGMKGTHLAFPASSSSSSSLGNNKNEAKGKKRAWLTLANLLNFPPRPDEDPDRSLALPLEYNGETQLRGPLQPDGIVEHLLEVRPGAAGNNGNNKNGETEFLGLDFFPFYGHATRHLSEMNSRYQQHVDNHVVTSPVTTQINGTSDATSQNGEGEDGLEERWDSGKKFARPTATFAYDWRRPLPELSDELHQFCCDTFPNQPVQIVAHSLGGLLTFGAMRQNPEKYKPGAVLVGVPFGTGIQYLQDMHKGYFTELNRCRQFLPPAQFTLSSHWSFFPMNRTELADTFVDVTNREELLDTFVPDVSSIGKISAGLQSEAIQGDPIVDLNFYDPDDWERHEFGIFDPTYRQHLSKERIVAYKEHMRIQMKKAIHWRTHVLGSLQEEEIDTFSPLVVCATDTVPTVNQILRRKRQAIQTSAKAGLKKRNSIATSSSEDLCKWEYDYSSGRSVPGDGRIDYAKAFPSNQVSYREVRINSTHAKQFCWEDNAGSWGKIWGEVVQQLQEYSKPESESKSVLLDSTAMTATEIGTKSRFLNRVHPRFVILKLRSWRQRRKVQRFTVGKNTNSNARRRSFIRQSLRRKNRKVESLPTPMEIKVSADIVLVEEPIRGKEKGVRVGLRKRIRTWRPKLKRKRKKEEESAIFENSNESMV
eukprot:CAMPEP_0198290022 /NCGR_PEP_ID=MMETSP1449-20131203/8019_1 /TAXON_ID=420275 /ORGANISM="Attheya septentrionalis, Strain CCMP2084" /LENGTH=777 /DNA_ID=CAMNT_0043988445 /DNA_START=206 /DNA_END=2539 /DNA_ORIENTATION=+